MGFFDTVLASLNDPRRATQESDLQSLLSAFGGSRGASSANADQMAGLIGGFLKPLLREQQMTNGLQGVDSLLHSLRQNADSPDRLRDLLGAERMDQMVGRAQQRTGLDANSILRLLSVALPAVIALLQSGRPAATPTGTVASAPRGTTPSGETNPILSQFLDADGDGDVDMADMVRLTSRFLQK
jgi:hypothetical protein